MNNAIKKFLEEAPEWLATTSLPAKVAWPNGSCCLCGTNREAIRALYEALKEDYGQVKWRKSREETGNFARVFK